MANLRRLTAAALAAAILACGGPGGEDGGAPQAVVRGTLSQWQEFPVAGQVSFAMQWMGAEYADPLVNGANVAPTAGDPFLQIACVDVEPLTPGTCDGTPSSGRQRCHLTDLLATALLRPVRYAPVFPIAFSVPLEGTPPPMALYDLARQGGRGAFAMGVVLAFVDSDGDGMLRLGTPAEAPEPGLANSAYQDYLPAAGAARRSYFVTYLDGEIAPASISPSFADVLTSLPKGYALWVKDEWVDAYGRRTAVRRRAEPMSTPVELVSRPGVGDAAFWCREWDADVTWVSEIPAGEVPDSCGSDGLGAYWTRTTSAGVCAYADRIYQNDFTCGGTAPEWDCPGP